MLHRVMPWLVACAVVSGGAAKVSAQDWDSEPVCGSNVPRSLFFAGAGGGLGLLCSGEQSVYNKGISTIFNAGTVLGHGTADGPPETPTLSTKANIIPIVQLGYFQHFGDSDWLWGVKGSYSYQGDTLTEHNLIIPQLGTSSIPGVPGFTGFSVIGSYDVFVDHQFILTPFVGRSFQNSFVYAGAGPSLSHVGASLSSPML